MKSYNDAFKIIILLQIALFGDLNNTHSPDKPEFTLSIQQEIRNKIPRPEGNDPLKIMHLDKPFIKELGESGENCWEAILK